MTHGWPGSFLEFVKVIGPLSDPESHGAGARDAFDLVVPSMPGFGFSARPQASGWNPERITGAWAELMRRLGYRRYVSQGGDWGAVVTDVLGRQPRMVWLVSTSPRCWERSNGHQRRTRKRRFRPRWPRRSRTANRRRRGCQPRKPSPMRHQRALPRAARLSGDTGHPPADDRLLARGLAGRLGRLVLREVHGVDRHGRRTRAALTKDEMLDDVALSGSQTPRRPRPASTGRTPPTKPRSAARSRSLQPSAVSHERSSPSRATRPSAPTRTSSTSTSSTGAVTSPPGNNRSFLRARCERRSGRCANRCTPEAAGHGSPPRAPPRLTAHPVTARRRQAHPSRRSVLNE